MFGRRILNTTEIGQKIIDVAEFKPSHDVRFFETKRVLSTTQEILEVFSQPQTGDELRAEVASMNQNIPAMFERIFNDEIHEDIAESVEYIFPKSQYKFEKVNWPKEGF